MILKHGTEDERRGVLDMSESVGGISKRLHIEEWIKAGFPGEDRLP